MPQPFDWLFEIEDEVEVVTVGRQIAFVVEDGRIEWLGAARLARGLEMTFLLGVGVDHAVNVLDDKFH
jgi:hypothetical protein